MHTVKLKVNDAVYEKFIHLLSKFSKDEIQIITETPDFAENQKYLTGELNEILDGQARFVKMEEAEQMLENIIKKHENNI
jgi:hypothetical protein